VYVVNDFVEEDADAGGVQVAVAFRVVDELGDFAEAELFGSLAEDKEEAVDDVGLSRAIGANDGGEFLRFFRGGEGPVVYVMKGPNCLDACVGLEVLELNFGQHKPGRHVAANLNI
jgi:hypothetical protein